jgi:ATP-dependent DNA ligase
MARLLSREDLITRRMLYARTCRPLGHIRPCLPSRAERPPFGTGWLHEIKHDGFRIMARRNKDGVRLYTRNGYDFAGRFPQIVEAVAKLKVDSCFIDGEAIVVDEHGLSAFNLLRSWRHDDAAVLCAFDLIELDGKDLRRTPIEQRKDKLLRLVHDQHPGIVLNIITTATAQLSSSTLARLVARASYRNGVVLLIAQGARSTGSRSRTRPRQP